jgi:hypothetical protein
LEPITLASRVVTLFETGRRESTYKLATMMAIIDICVEADEAGDGTLAVPVNEIVHRLIAYYWPQARPFDNHALLRQTKTGEAIPDQVARTRAILEADSLRTAEAAREVRHPAYERLVRELRQKVAQQPLTHLQTAEQSGSVLRDDFLFDATAFGKKMTRGEVEAADPIRLRPGIASALRAAAPLLKAYIRNLWSAEVVRLNRVTLEATDLDAFLFGESREALHSVLALPLAEIQHGQCFYCDRTMVEVEVDHVVPWSRIPINGVANLVAADRKCNGNKSATMPVRDHIDAALSRVDLEEIATISRIPVLHERTADAAHGIFTTMPVGTWLWRNRGVFEAYHPG